MNTIKVNIKSIYGTEKVYPICDKAKTFASIAGTKTLTTHTIERIKALDYKIEVVSEVKEL